MHVLTWSSIPACLYNSGSVHVACQTSELLSCKNGNPIHRQATCYENCPLFWSYATLTVQRLNTLIIKNVWPVGRNRQGPLKSPFLLFFCLVQMCTQGSEPVKSMVPSIWFLWKKKFSCQLGAKVWCQGPVSATRAQPWNVTYKKRGWWKCAYISEVWEGTCTYTVNYKGPTLE